MTDLAKTALISRLAPTPSGLLHIGNALSFVLTWVLMRGQGGRILLRIDDLDRQRYRRAYVEDIFYTLDWLGLDYDMGPAGPDEFAARYSQLHRMDLYEKWLAHLRAAGLVYACTCSRKRIRQTAMDGIRYDGHCRRSPIPLETQTAAWRVRLPEKAYVTFTEWGSPTPISKNLQAGMGDFVVRKKDAYPAYQLASVADDAHWNVNFVVRGEDLLWSTAAQYWIAEQVGIPTFQEATFWHHELLLDDRGQKLAKSRGASSLQSWREAGRTPTAIYRLAAQFLDLPPAAGDSLSNLLMAFKKKINETQP